MTKLYAGLDVSLETTSICVVDTDGRVRLPATLPWRHCDRNHRLVDIKTHKYGILHPDLSPILQARRQPCWRNPRKENAAGETSDPVNSRGIRGSCRAGLSAPRTIPAIARVAALSRDTIAGDPAQRRGRRKSS